ncbi:MAG: ferrous iron transport protein B [Spirosomataceae bacterium]
MKNTPTIALVGNPNSGKSSLFNQLTGLRQKTGNFPGVTVDKKEGICQLDRYTEIKVIDLPGTYSLYPKSLDEQVVLNVLANPQNGDYPDVVVVVADASNLKRNLLLFTQVRDLGFHTVLALNMLDVAERHGLDIDDNRLSERLGVPVVFVNAKKGEGIPNLKFAVKGELVSHEEKQRGNLTMKEFDEALIEEIKQKFSLDNDYLAMLHASQFEKFNFLKKTQQQHLIELNDKYHFEKLDFQTKETIKRYETLSKIVDESVGKKGASEVKSFTSKLDRILLHRVWGYLIFFAILFLIFEAIFSLAKYPMDAIDSGVAALTDWVKSVLPESKLTDLLTDGLLAGMGGVVVFIPQIAFLTCFISLLEESGYMARVMVIMDKLMRKFGLNGRSVVPLISSVACAVPAILSTRTINNWKDRLITIMVTPLMSCSARLPIYTIMIALVVPDQKLWGFIDLQAITLMGLYLLGFVAAILSAWVIQKILRTKERSYFIMEMPTFQSPRFSHVSMAVWNSIKTFVTEAGKVIVAVSIVLWVLASYGPGDSMAQAEKNIVSQNPSLNHHELSQKIASAKLENSYAGRFGKLLEPVIKPLGYDWKIGIALITSFAAREVFVGTMSTIYSLGGSDDDTDTVKERLRTEINPSTGKPLYTPALGFSLLIYYAFAMQCMSTLAATYRETKNWRYPILQLAYMSVLAYVCAWAVFSWLQ